VLAAGVSLCAASEVRSADKSVKLKINR